MTTHMSDAGRENGASHAEASLDADSLKAIQAILTKHAHTDGPLLLILQEIQSALGFVPDAAVLLIADGLNVTRAQVHGVLTFYPQLRRSAPGRHLLQLCRAEACLSMQGRALEHHAVQRLATELGDTTADGALTLQGVYCLGLCAMAPALMLDGEPMGRVTSQQLDELLSSLGVVR